MQSFLIRIISGKPYPKIFTFLYTCHLHLKVLKLKLFHFKACKYFSEVFTCIVKENWLHILISTESERKKLSIQYFLQQNWTE